MKADCMLNVKFTFPEDTKEFQYIENEKQLARMLRKQPKSFGRPRYRIQGNQRLKGHAIYVFCDRCKAAKNEGMKLTYFKKTGYQFYKVERFNNDHEHYIPDIELKEYDIMKEMKIMIREQTMSPKEMINKIMFKYRIAFNTGQTLFNRAQKKLKLHVAQFEDITPKLNKFQFDYVKVEKQHPEFSNIKYVESYLLFRKRTFNEIKADEDLYKQFCYFYIVKEAAAGYPLGAFVIFNKNFNMELLALGMFNRVTQQNIREMLQLFLKRQGSHPKVILTDFRQQICQAVKKMQDSNQLLSEHIINPKNVYRKCVQGTQFGSYFPKQNKALLQHLRNLFTCPSKQQFQDQLQAILDWKRDLRPVMQKVMPYVSQCCLSQLGSNFIFTPFWDRHKFAATTTGFSTDGSEVKRNLNILSKHAHLTTFLPSLKYFFENPKKPAIDFCFKKIYEIDFMPQVRNMRYKMNRIPFEVFVEQAKKTLYYHCQKVSDKQLKIYEDPSNYFLVRKEDDRWVCQCQYSMKTGLPCSHEIKGCLFMKESMNQQVASLFFQTDELDLSEKQKANGNQTEAPRKCKLQLLTLADFYYNP